MNDDMYLLDNNVLSHMSRTHCASEFFLQRCRVPTAVLHEADGHPDAAAFQRIEYVTTARVLRFLSTVMASLAIDDIALVDLYANKGAADPMLIACALDGMHESSEALFGPTWVIVSNDKAVRATATKIGIRTMPREAFLSDARGQLEM